MNMTAIQKAVASSRQIPKQVREPKKTTGADTCPECQSNDWFEVKTGSAGEEPSDLRCCTDCLVRGKLITW
jgi:DNA-directed RNA polymerase subunit M/transcription elongation factor TFIIS